MAETDPGTASQVRSDRAVAPPRLPRLLRRQRLRLFLRLVANGVVQAAVVVATALLVRFLFDRVQTPATETDAAGFLRAVAGLMALVLAFTGLRVLERRDAEQLSQHYVTTLRLKLFDAVAEIPVWRLNRRSRGPLMLHFAGDLTAVQQWVGRGLARLVVAGLSAAGMLAALCAIDAWLGAAGLAAVAAGALAAVLLGPPLERRVGETRRRRGRLAAQIADRLQALAHLRLFDRRTSERQRLRRRSRRLAESAVGRAWLSGVIRGLPDAVYGLTLALVLVIAAHRQSGGALTVGALVAALAMVGLLALPLRDLARAFDYWQGYKVARRKLEQMLGDAAEAGDSRPTRRVPGSGAISFVKVRLVGLFENFSAEVADSTLVAIVGPTGGGKSALLALAAGLLRPARGRVRLDGLAVDRLLSATAARTVGMVSPDLPLLRGSICDNIIYRVSTATAEEVSAAVGAVGLDTALAELAMSLDSPIADSGVNLPAGIAQRVQLARALLGRPKLLLLDEPDRGLDPAGRAALDRLLAGRRCTVLLVTQDLMRARSADRLWFVERGRLIEDGPPGELLSRDGPTAHFFGTTLVSPRLVTAS